MSTTKAGAETSRADRSGILVAFACFVHCIAGPILLSFAGLRSLIGVSEKLNPLFLVASSAVAVIALVPAYRRRHRRIICLVLFGAGVLSLALGRQTPRGFEMAATICGATLIVSAHILNMRLASRCSCCSNGSLEPVEKSRKGGVIRSVHSSDEPVHL